MEVGHDVKASLCINMQTLDTLSFTMTVKNTTVPLSSLQEPSGVNIFHEIANCLVRETFLLQFLEILISEFQDRYFDEAESIIKSMINTGTGREGQTPLMISLQHNRKVRNYIETDEKIYSLWG